MQVNNRELAKSLLDSWVQYINLDDKMNAKIKGNDVLLDSTKRSPCKINGDRLYIPKGFFDDLKKTAENNEISKQDQNSAIIGLSFPTIVKKDKTILHYHPLFIMDITSVFTKEYEIGGWNIHDFEFIVSKNNINEILRIEIEDSTVTISTIREHLNEDGESDADDEDGVEDTNISNAIHFFNHVLKVEGTFEEIAPQLYNHVETIKKEYSDHYSYISEDPYVFYYKGENFNVGLKKDLVGIQKQIDRLSESNLGLHYLSFDKGVDDAQSIYYGAYLDHPPTNSQARAMYQKNKIAAVQGPPGSGKTSLILHVVAQQITKRASALVYENKQINNLTMVTSSNNQAVTNVVERFYPKKIQSASEEQQNLISNVILESGNRKVIKLKTKEKIEKLVKEIQEKEFDQDRYLALITEFKDIKSKIDNFINRLYELINQYKTSQEKLAVILRDVEEIQGKIKSTEVDTEKLVLQLDNNATASEFDVTEFLLDMIINKNNSTCFDNIRFDIEKLINEYQSMGWIKRFLNPIFKFKEKAYGRFSTLRGSDIKVIRTHKYKSLRLKLDNELENMIQDRDHMILIEQLLDVVSVYDKQKQVLESKLKNAETERVEIVNIETKIKELFEIVLANSEEQSISIIEVMNIFKYDKKSLYDLYHRLFHRVNNQLFLISLEILWQSALRNKEKIIEDLNVYKELLDPNTKKEAIYKVGAGNLEVTQFFTNISLVFPLITTTLNSASNVIPLTNEGTIDKIIADEAAMTECHKLYPLMHRANSALVVGDPRQIEPIESFTSNYKQKYKNEIFLHAIKIKFSKVQRETLYRNYSPVSSVGTAFNLASLVGINDKGKEEKNVIKLVEHFRCQGSIIKYCDDICDYGLEILTPIKVPVLGSELIAYNVHGNIVNNVNYQEIGAIDEIISHLLSKGYRIENIGVISPFRAQADMLRTVLRKKYSGMDYASVGTVHTFQGGQRQVIILSTMITNLKTNSKKASFVNKSPNILNVAVSRAEDLFILVGDLYILEKSGRYLTQLVKHIEVHGIIQEINPESVEVKEKEKLPEYSLVTDCEHIDLFEDILTKFKDRLIIVTPWVRGNTAEKFAQAIKGRHQKVKIIYGWKDSDVIEERELKLIEKLKKSNTIVIDSRKLGIGTHEKIVIMDDELAVIGSWNWLSHSYYASCKKKKQPEGVVVRHERSVKTTDKRIIEELLHDIDNKFGE